MRCPDCNDDNHSDYKRPAQVAGDVYRRHRCKSCGVIFLSREKIVTSSEILNGLPETFLRQTLDGLDTSSQAGQDFGPTTEITA